jgi:hypothetical protein
MTSSKRRFPGWFYGEEEALNPVFLWIIGVGVVLVILILYFTLSYPP